MSESFSDDLSAAIAAAIDRDEAGSAAPAGNEAAGGGDRHRDEGGRFARQEGEAAPAGAGQAAAPEDDYEDGIGFERDAWSRVPAEFRPTLKSQAQQRRDLEARVKGLEPIQQAFGPNRDVVVARFGSEARAVETMMHLMGWADRDFPGFIREQARIRGVNLASLAQQDAQGQGQGQGGQSQDPMDILRGAIRDEMRQEQQQAQMGTMVQAVEAFAADPKNEYFSQVMPAVSALLATEAVHRIPDPVKRLEAAYDMAIHADPVIRAKLAAAQAKQEQGRAAQAAAERQSAAASLTGSPGTARPSGRGAAPEDDLEAMLYAEYDRRTGRV